MAECEFPRKEVTNTCGLYRPVEKDSDFWRKLATRLEPQSLRTYTPTHAILARSSGIYHWTPENRRLYDFTSGVLVANLGHNPASWVKRFWNYMQWPASVSETVERSDNGYVPALPMTAYNAITSVEVQACRRLIDLLQSKPGGARLEQVFWAASGSEAVQKALWCAMARDPNRDMIIATRFGFHGKKGLAGAVTGSESDHDRDARVHFISFPMKECVDVTMRGQPFDATPYAREIQSLYRKHGQRLGALITEPYLGGGGSYHPPASYLQLVERFCREHDLIFILDEVQSNFGRTGRMFAFETYGVEPDIVVLGKGLGNGVPVAAAVGRTDLFGTLDYGEGSDTWSANPLSCAAVLATLDEFAADDVLGKCRLASEVMEKGLIALKELPFVAHVRGEKGGMVWGVEMRDYAGRSTAEWANAAVLTCYIGSGDEGIHLLGPLAKKVLRIAPPLVITPQEAEHSTALMKRALFSLLELTLSDKAKS
jgi:4-aminobutyrate aminotransferase-like enzyme